jgi:hypothetical protein
MSGTPMQELAEKGGVYIDELDPENRQILDHRTSNIVRYAYPKEDKINRIATAALIINRMIGGCTDSAISGTRKCQYKC